MQIETSQRIEVLLGAGVLPPLATRLARRWHKGRCAIVTSETVARWYLEPLRQELTERGLTAEPIVIADPEDGKTAVAALGLVERLLGAGIGRGGFVIGLGGGVIGDLAGFAAATCRGGMSYVAVPTTLLAMVDAPLDGRVAVHLPAGHDLMGCRIAPDLVAIGVDLLRTLPLTHFGYGLVEALRHGAIADAAYFRFVQRSVGAVKARDQGILQRLIRRSLNLKRTLLSVESTESGKRRGLRFGRSFARAVEAAGGFRRHHPAEAGGLGMLLALAASRRLERLRADYRETLEAVLAELSLPVRLPREFTAAELFAAMRADLEWAGDKTTLVLPVELGRVEAVEITADRLQSLLVEILPGLQGDPAPIVGG